MAKLRVEIVTPTGSVLDATASAVTLPGTLGEANVLPGHRPALMQLNGGKIELEGSDADVIAIRGGIAEVRPDGILVLADDAAPVKSLDLDEAKAGLRALNEGMSTGILDNERLLRIEADRRYFEAILG